MARSIAMSSCGRSQDGNVFGRETELQQPRVVDRQEPFEDAMLGWIAVGSKKQPAHESGAGQRFDKRRGRYVFPEANCHDHYSLLLDPRVYPLARSEAVAAMGDSNPDELWLR
jgi:hypothetical protein